MKSRISILQFGISILLTIMISLFWHIILSNLFFLSFTENVFQSSFLQNYLVVTVWNGLLATVEANVFLPSEQCPPILLLFYLVLSINIHPLDRKSVFSHEFDIQRSSFSKILPRLIFAASAWKIVRSDNIIAENM